jgi:hypothetical protein
VLGANGGMAVHSLESTVTARNKRGGASIAYCEPLEGTRRKRDGPSQPRHVELKLMVAMEALVAAAMGLLTSAKHHSAAR